MSQDVTDSPNGKRPKDETPSKSSKKRGSSSSNKKKTSSSFEFDNIELSKPFNVEKRVHVDFTSSGYAGLPEDMAEQLSELESAYRISTSNLPTSEKILTMDELLNKDNPEEIYTDQRVIGAGSYGQVYYARDKFKARDVAIKKMQVDLDDPALEGIRREISLLRFIKHPNIIDYFDTFYLNNQLWLTMEYMAYGALANLLDYEVNQKMGEPEIAYILEQLLNALNYIHNMHCIHRDIKSDNVLVGENGEIKLADFGLACQLTANKKTRTDAKVGSAYWMSPECIAGNYDWKTDIWSLGVLCIELMQGEPPLAHMPPDDTIKEIAKNGIVLHTHIADSQKWSPGLLNFLNQCLEKNPTSRPSAAGLLKHPFLKSACTAKDFANFLKKAKKKGKGQK
jgi:serine/threonine protein kinase